MIAAVGVAALVAWAAARTLRAPVARLRPVRAAQRRRRTDATSELIALLDTVAAELRTGASLGAAHRSAVAAHPDAPPLAEFGGDADAALAGQALAAAAMGGAAAAAVDAAATTLRERRAVRLERAAHAAQARLSARVLTAVPLLFAAWAATTSASTRRAYTDSPLGVAALCAGLALNAAGWWWMRHVVGARR